MFDKRLRERDESMTTVHECDETLAITVHEYDERTTVYECDETLAITMHECDESLTTGPEWVVKVFLPDMST